MYILLKMVRRHHISDKTGQFNCLKAGDEALIFGFHEAHISSSSTSPD